MSSIFDFDDSQEMVFQAKTAGKALIAAKYDALQVTGDFLFNSHTDGEFAQRCAMVDDQLSNIAYRKLVSISDSKTKLVKALHTEWSLRHAKCADCFKESSKRLAKTTCEKCADGELDSDSPLCKACRGTTASRKTASDYPTSFDCRDCPWSTDDPREVNELIVYGVKCPKCGSENVEDSYPKKDSYSDYIKCPGCGYVDLHEPSGQCGFCGYETPKITASQKTAMQPLYLHPLENAAYFTGVGAAGYAAIQEGVRNYKDQKEKNNTRVYLEKSGEAQCPHCRATEDDRYTAFTHDELKKNNDGSYNLKCYDCGDKFIAGPAVRKSSKLADKDNYKIECGNCGKLSNDNVCKDCASSQKPEYSAKEKKRTKKLANKYIEKRGDSWVILQKDTGKVLSHHDSKEKAKASFSAMMQSKHGKSQVDSKSCSQCGSPVAHKDVRGYLELCDKCYKGNADDARESKTAGNLGIPDQCDGCDQETLNPSQNDWHSENGLYCPDCVDKGRCNCQSCGNDQDYHGIDDVIRHDQGHDDWHAMYGDAPCNSDEDCAAKASRYDNIDNMRKNGEPIQETDLHDQLHEKWHRDNGDEPCTSAEDCDLKSRNYKQSSVLDPNKEAAAKEFFMRRCKGEEPNEILDSFAQNHPGVTPHGIASNYFTIINQVKNDPNHPLRKYLPENGNEFINMEHKLLTEVDKKHGL